MITTIKLINKLINISPCIVFVCVMIAPEINLDIYI